MIGVVLSRRTLAALVRALAVWGTHSRLSVLSYEYHVEDQGGSVERRALALVRALEQSRPDALVDLIERTMGCTSQEYREGNPAFVALGHALQLDGLEFRDGRLCPTTPVPAALSPSASILEEQLKLVGLETAATHYRQASDNFTDSNWEACNGQIRPFVEDLFIEVGARIARHRRSDPMAALQDMRAAGFLDEPEFQQWKALWAGIQDKGPHRGVSAEAEALYRLHQATSIARYLLAKVTR